MFILKIKKDNVNNACSSKNIVKYFIIYYQTCVNDVQFTSMLFAQNIICDIFYN